MQFFTYCFQVSITLFLICFLWIHIKRKKHNFCAIFVVLNMFHFFQVNKTASCFVT